MSNDIKLKDSALISYTRSENAVEAFNMTVKNGQARLALQALVDIVNSLVERVTSLEETINKSNSEIKPPKSLPKEDKEVVVATETVKQNVASKKKEEEVKEEV